MFYIVLGALTFERNIFWRLCTGRRRRDEEEEEEEEEEEGGHSYHRGSLLADEGRGVSFFLACFGAGPLKREIIGTEN